MQRLFNLIRPHLGKLIIGLMLLFVGVIIYLAYQAPVDGFDDKLIYLLKRYGYIILFAWAILEGEAGLFMAGLLSHTGDMNVVIAVFIAGLGGFVGDQIYFYIGRYNKRYVQHKLRGQRRKLALAHLLLKKYGWPIIFTQRYMYGLRTILPISIGLTRYSAKKFALINLISAWCWAAITIVPTWYFGRQILEIIHWLIDHLHFVIPAAAILFLSVGLYLYSYSRRTSKLTPP